MKKHKKWVAEATLTTYDQITGIKAKAEKEAIEKARRQFIEENPDCEVSDIQVWRDEE